jgi:hypothetical protein
MKGMKIVFGLVVISVMAMGLGSANAAIFDSGGFEGYTAGYASIVGQDGWVGFNEVDGAVINGGSSEAKIASADEDAYMPGFNWLYLGKVSDRNASDHRNGIYRPFAAQTGMVHLEVMLNHMQSNSSKREISLRDSSDAEYATIAALVGSATKYGEPGDRQEMFYAYDGENTVWDYDHDVEAGSWGYYIITIDANVATQTYDATVTYGGDNYFYGSFVEVASWTGLSFAGTVADISRVYVESDQSVSQWDNFLIEGSGGTSTIPGDFDADNDVDGVDFGLWQAGYPTTSGASLIDGDADADGDVDGVDFGIWQANYPTNVGAAAIPEPATICLLALAGTVLLARRRR